MLKFGAICYFMHVFSLEMKMYFKIHADMKICKKKLQQNLHIYL